MAKVLGLYDNDPVIVGLQRFLNEKLKLELKPDGGFGKITQSALATWQEAQGFKETDEHGVCFGEKTQAMVVPFCNRKYLSHSAFQEATQELGIEVAVLKAVTRVEAKQFGFLPSGMPVILFERHIFYKNLVKFSGKAFADAQFLRTPDICNPESGGYIGGEAEVGRLNKAIAISFEQANLSASFGLFQIMAFNHAQAGYTTCAEYVAAMQESETLQLKAFCNYIKNDKDGSLLRNLKAKNFAGFAAEYNGPAYQKNNYDNKLQAEYNKALTETA